MTPKPSSPSAPSTQTSSPALPATPPADVLKQDFSTDAAEEAELFGSSDTPAKTPAEPAKTPTEPQKKEEVTPVEPTAPEAKKEEPKSEPQKIDGPNLLKPLVEKKQTAGTRDYTGFTEEETRILKSMSNEAFNHVAPLLKNRKELERLKDATYLQHPDSYTLHPQYKQAQQQVYAARSEADAWQQQLIKIRSGEKWTPLVGVDPQTGKYIYGPEREPTVQDEEQVRLSMNRCLQYGEQAQHQLQQMPQQFQHIVQQDLLNIQQERARRFDWVANPELLKHELEFDGGQKRSIESIRSEFLNYFPVYQRNTIGAEVAADLFVAMQVYAQRLKLAEAGKQVAETLKQEATRVEPTAITRPSKSSAPKFGVTEFSLDGLPA